MAMVNETGIPIRYGFDVVDSSAWEYFIGNHRSSYRVRRVQLATGLARYVFNDTKRDVGAIHFRSYRHDLTVATALINEQLLLNNSLALSTEDALRKEIWKFIEWLDATVKATQQHYDEIHDIATAFAELTFQQFRDTTTEQNTSGRTWPEDTEAIASLRSHPEQREEIRQIWTSKVRQNRKRKLSADSMGSMWRRLVQRARSAD